MPAATDGVAASNRFDAVLFDWRGTLVHDPGHTWWITRALQRLGRPSPEAEVTALVDAVRRAEQLPDHRAADQWLDTSAALHREATLGLYADSGLDPELADALYLLDFDPASHPYYPDALDVLSTIHAWGATIVIVSDIHFDLRAEFAAQGMDALIDGFVLSFEHGVQKPDGRMFELALDVAGVRAADALMVGDRATHDGGAAAIGITTLILPMPDGPQKRHLGPVVDLLGSPNRPTLEIQENEADD
jgi:FMN phosphatase YigB (HAD superfamily)